LTWHESNRTVTDSVSTDGTTQTTERMHMTKKIGLVLGALLLIGAIATGCGNSDKTTASSSSSSSEVAMTGGPPATSGPTITISGMAFGAPLTVSPGATITIVNEDTVEHSVTSDPKGAFDTHVDGGEQKTFTAPDKPGEYPIICVYHPSMHGTLIVK
jgi:plastocyanin